MVLKHAYGRVALVPFVCAALAAMSGCNTPRDHFEVISSHDASSDVPGESPPFDASDETSQTDFAIDRDSASEGSIDLAPDQLEGDSAGSVTRCGDGIPQAYEECDDGNTLESDGCYKCRLEWIPVAGANFTCAWSALGAKCWGDNSSGQLGLGDKKNRGVTESPKALDILPLGHQVLAMSAGSAHVCALVAGGLVKCWGDNTSGQLGLGDVATRGDDETLDAVPFVPLGSKAVAIASGAAFNCAILEGGDVKCWGANGTGQLGLGDVAARGDNEVPSSFPPLQLGQVVRQMALGAGHSCALLSDGSVKCWGDNTTGQLGLGDMVMRGDKQSLASLPTVPLPEVLRISAGSSHTCALLPLSKVTCWGSNVSGQLGLGDVGNRGDNEAISTVPPLGPALLGGTPVGVVAGGIRTCALTSGGLKCWGGNGPGALGLGDTASRGDDETLDMVPFVSMEGVVTSVSIGGGHVCAWIRDQGLKCWGANGAGQLGYADAMTRGNTPATVPSQIPYVQIH